MNSEDEAKRGTLRVEVEVPTGLFAKTKKKVVATLVGLPNSLHRSTGDLPKPDDAALQYVETTLLKPIFALLGKFEERNKLPTPQVRLEFVQPLSLMAERQVLPTLRPSADDSISAEQFHLDTPRWSLAEVILPPATKMQLEIVLNLVQYYELMYVKWNLRSLMRSTTTALTLNFYGPSGTGKTLCAQAVATYLNKKLLSVNYAELESKYVGDMNKNIRKAFDVARSADAVLFFDEADSILGKRLTAVTQAADHGINMARSVLLIELERFTGVVIFASNLIRNYDSAFTRRILHHVHFELPDQECRQQIYQLHLPIELPITDDVTIERLAILSDGFGGGDIRNVVLKAAAHAAASLNSDADKKVTMSMFEQAIGTVRESYLAIGGRPGQAWVDERADKQPEA